MPTIRIVGNTEDFSPRPGSKRDTSRGSTRYMIRCKGLTQEECNELRLELCHWFRHVITVRKNPALPSVNWGEVFRVVIDTGATVGITGMLDFVGSFVKERLVKGRKQKTIELYGPDGEVVKRFRKPPLH